MSSAGNFDEFFEDKNDEVRERLFQEFNSLSVVYGKPSERFLKENELKHSLAAEKKYFPERRRKGRLRNNPDVEADNEKDAADTTESNVGDTTATTVNQSVEDLIGLGAPTNAPAAQPIASAADDLLGLGPA